MVHADCGVTTAQANAVLPTPQTDAAGAKVLMIDNYDSFTWNLYQYLCLLGAEVTVVRSQACTLDELVEKHPDLTHLVISPGPGHPLRDSGISIPALQHYAGKVPIFGVCMGLQCMYTAYGGVVDGAGEVVHGKTSEVQHDGKGLFKGVSQGINSTRYHSLAAHIGSMPPDMEVTSRTGGSPHKGGGGVVMGIRHKVHAMEAVQYHPESILSEEGKVLMTNFLRLRGGTWAENPGSGVGEEPAANPTSKAASASSAVAQAAPSAPAKLPTILEKICKQRVLDVAAAKATPGSSPADLQTRIGLHIPPPQIDFYKRVKRAGKEVALMAEIKRASPSKGSFVTASTPSPPEIALSYALAGASTISVLTEPTWFKGTLLDMLSVRMALEGLPDRPAVLRKDFILDPYQIDEARCYGADTVLLIVACLGDDRLALLYRHALSLGMEPLVEVNNPPELERALKLGAKVIGVNNRNLHDFNVDMGTTSRLADSIRARKGESGAGEVVLCALSGITGRADVVQYAKEGVGAVLVGEALMRAKDKGAFVRQLLGTEIAVKGVSMAPPDGLVPSPRAGYLTGTAVPPECPPPLVKICGIKTPAVAVAAAEAGADFLGLVFVPKSKRCVSLQQAQAIAAAVRARTPAPVAPAKPAAAHPDPTDWFAFQAHELTSTTRRRPLLVGVFQDAPLSAILGALSTVPLDAVQLHGSEPLEWCRLLNVPVIKAFHVSDAAGAALNDGSLREVARPGYHAVPLLDTQLTAAKGSLSGGAGRAFDWSVATAVADQAAARESGLAAGRLPLVLAGGLDATNVRKGVEQVRPWAVDVSGGVETDGEKDEAKIRKFLTAAKGVTA